MKRNIAVLPVALALLISCGCMKRMAAPAPPPPPETILGDADDTPTASLFKGDQAVLSDQDIARILGTQLNLQDRHRLAVLNLSSTNFWSEDLAQTEAKNFDNLVAALKASQQFTEVRLLPSLLVPEKRTVPYLREAAARVQADLLFIYTTRIQYFRRDRFFKTDEVHAQCVAESVLLDVRTGIVAHTDHASEDIAMKKAPGDLNFDETIARAQSEARGRAMMSLANSLNAYLAQQKNRAGK
ncbi:MAG: hypothetical protein ACRD51_18405 [Candidatus Acidiferrum sp.]